MPDPSPWICSFCAAEWCRLVGDSPDIQRIPKWQKARVVNSMPSTLPCLPPGNRWYSWTATALWQSQAGKKFLLSCFYRFIYNSSGYSKLYHRSVQSLLRPKFKGAERQLPTSWSYVYHSLARPSWPGIQKIIMLYFLHSVHPRWSEKPKSEKKVIIHCYAIVKGYISYPWRSLLKGKIPPHTI